MKTWHSYGSFLIINMIDRGIKKTEGLTGQVSPSIEPIYFT